MFIFRAPYFSREFMTTQFRQATHNDHPQIWALIEKAILRRKNDGSNQWQDGYPNPTVISNDINKNAGYVLTSNEIIVGYCAVLINDEPEYKNIEGNWVTNSDFVVFHRLAVSEDYLGKGLAKKIIQHIHEFALSQNIKSVKADTNFDNLAMLKIFESLGYVYCGQVYFRGSPRKAFEKVL